MDIKLINCPVCGEPAEIFSEGVARAIYNEHGNKTEMYFTEFDGYAVRCSNCFEQTVFFNTIKEAVESWNDSCTIDDAINSIINDIDRFIYVKDTLYPEEA